MSQGDSLKAERNLTLGKIVKRTVWSVLGLVLLVLSLLIARQYRQVQATVTKLDAQTDLLKNDLQRSAQEEAATEEQLLSYVRRGIPFPMRYDFWGILDDRQKQEAIEIILANLEHANPSIREIALRQTEEIRQYNPVGFDANIDSFVPKLARSLLPSERRKDRVLRFDVANSLTLLGPRAKAAAPELRQLAHAEDPSFSWNAVRILLEIDPQEDLSAEIAQLIRSRMLTMAIVEMTLPKVVGKERTQAIIRDIQAKLDQDPSEEPAEGKVSS